MLCVAQIKEAAPADAPVRAHAQFVAAAEVKARTQIVELAANEQPTDFALTLNVLAIIQLSDYKVGSTLDVVAILQQSYFLPAWHVQSRCSAVA